MLENPLFIDDFPIKTSIIQRLFHCQPHLITKGYLFPFYPQETSMKPPWNGELNHHKITNDHRIPWKNPMKISPIPIQMSIERMPFLGWALGWRWFPWLNPMKISWVSQLNHHQITSRIPSRSQEVDVAAAPYPKCLLHSWPWTIPRGARLPEWEDRKKKDDPSLNEEKNIGI